MRIHASNAARAFLAASTMIVGAACSSPGGTVDSDSPYAHEPTHGDPSGKADYSSSADRIVVIVRDDASSAWSETELSQVDDLPIGRELPRNRELLARLLWELDAAGASTVVFGIMFGEQHDGATDLLVEALDAVSFPVVLPTMAGFTPDPRIYSSDRFIGHPLVDEEIGSSGYYVPLEPPLTASPTAVSIMHATFAAQRHAQGMDRQLAEAMAQLQFASLVEDVAHEVTGGFFSPPVESIEPGVRLPRDPEILEKIPLINLVDILDPASPTQAGHHRDTVRGAMVVVFDTTRDTPREDYLGNGEPLAMGWAIPLEMHRMFGLE